MNQHHNPFNLGTSAPNGYVATHAGSMTNPEKEPMTDQYKCPSFYDDSNVLKDCTCGKCAYPKKEPNIIANIVNNLFLDSDYQGKDWEAVRVELIKQLSTPSPEKESCEWEEEFNNLFPRMFAGAAGQYNKHGDERPYYNDRVIDFIRDLLTSTHEEATALARREERERILKEVEARMPSHDAVQEYLQTLADLSDNIK